MNSYAEYHIRIGVYTLDKIITVIADRCGGCRTCLRSCPAEQANIVGLSSDGGFTTDVNHEKCISCGMCLSVCPEGARDHSDDTAAFMNYIKKNRSALVVSPAIRNAFPDKWKKILDYFKDQGTAVYDGSFGADINAWATLRVIEQNKAGNIISANCPAAVNYIYMYKPSLVKYLSPVFSPEVCEAVYIRNYLRRDGAIAVLSSCTAKISEGGESGCVDYSLSFDKLMEYFDRKHIRIENNTSDDDSYPFDDKTGQLGALYCRPGGLREMIRLFSDKIQVCSSSGAEYICRELDGYDELGEAERPRLFDVLFCKNGCLGGSSNYKAVFDPQLYSSDIVSEYMKKKKSGVLRGNDDKLFKKFDEVFSPDSFLKIHPAPKETAAVSDENIERVFRRLGKFEEKDKRVNCGFCGYASCRKFAEAVYRGLNVPEGCIMNSSPSTGRSGDDEAAERLESVAAECRSYSELLFGNIVSLRERIRVISGANSEIGDMSAAIITLLDNIINLTRKKDYMDENALASLTNVLEKISSGLHLLETNIKNTYRSSEEIESIIAELTALSEELNVTVYDASHADKYAEY